MVVVVRVVIMLFVVWFDLFLTYFEVLGKSDCHVLFVFICFHLVLIWFDLF